MKKPYFGFLIFGIATFILGCAGKQIDPDLLRSPDEKALYDLMVERCHVLNNKDLEGFLRIYTKNSPELPWIKSKGLPLWMEYEVTFEIYSLKKLSIVGNDAAANFKLYHSNKYGTTFYKDVEVLYFKEGNQWKIESVGER